LLRLILLITVAACSTAYAAEECYTADAADGEVTFRVMQRGAPYTGNFLRFAGEACFAGLKGVDFFDVHDFPSVTFASTSVQPQGNEQLTRGTLEIKGNRREVNVLLHTRRKGDKMNLSGSFTLDRLQYGIGMGDWTNTKWLGAEVKLDIDATLSRKK
jgi:polyisoprenoid-binding protein YceI